MTSTRRVEIPGISGLLVTAARWVFFYPPHPTPNFLCPLSPHLADSHIPRPFVCAFPFSQGSHCSFLAQPLYLIYYTPEGVSLTLSCQ